jgi:hypothetical protein
VISSADLSAGEVTFRGMGFRVQKTSTSNGVLKMNVRLHARNGSSELVFNRHFNVFSSETDSDDVL